MKQIPITTAASILVENLNPNELRLHTTLYNIIIVQLIVPSMGL